MDDTFCETLVPEIVDNIDALDWQSNILDVTIDGDEGAKKVAEVLATNTTLTKLSLMVVFVSFSKSVVD